MLICFLSYFLFLLFLWYFSAASTRFLTGCCLACNTSYTLHQKRSPRQSLQWPIQQPDQTPPVSDAHQSTLAKQQRLRVNFNRCQGGGRSRPDLLISSPSTRDDPTITGNSKESPDPLEPLLPEPNTLTIDTEMLKLASNGLLWIASTKEHGRSLAVSDSATSPISNQT